MFERNYKQILSAALSQLKKSMKGSNQYFLTTDTSKADKNHGPRDSDRFIHARMRRKGAETKTDKKKQILVLDF